MSVNGLILDNLTWNALQSASWPSYIPRPWPEKHAWLLLDDALGVVCEPCDTTSLRSWEARLGSPSLLVVGKITTISPPRPAYTTPQYAAASPIPGAHLWRALAIIGLAKTQCNRKAEPDSGQRVGFFHQSDSKGIQGRSPAITKPRSKYAF